jgi:dTDP-4-dehydrorhamnose 3,5-epimerase
MKFLPTGLTGAVVIEPEPLRDERGSFSRTFCREEFRAHGIELTVVQCSVSFNVRRGTLRGLHYQAPPKAEAKLVRCTAGEAFDVIADLRPGSPTFGRWFATELTAAGGRMIYVPEGFAHGFQTLRDETELFYMVSESYSPPHARGVRWDDPQLGIRWPMAPTVMSARDRELPALDQTGPLC